MDTRYCPNCRQPLPAGATTCSMCAETVLSARTLLRNREKQFVSNPQPRLLNIRYRPLTESTNKAWARGGRAATPTLEAEDDMPLADSLNNIKSQQTHYTLWAGTKRRNFFPFPPKLLFWLSSIVLLALVAAGVFGVAITLGHGLGSNGAPTLQLTPTRGARGAIITLRGSHFSPHAFIGLNRDINIPLIDTDDRSIIQTDNQGNFSDTAIIDGSWSAGTHSIHAEDALMHKIASSPLMVSGEGLLQRPPHLILSTTKLDFGAGDPATDSTKIVILSNAGGGQISWSATSNQPWLQFTPQQGSFSPQNNPDVGVVLAIDRTNLSPGSYSANLVILSNAGKANISVKMQVVPFKARQGAILEVSPSVLSFTASPGGQSPVTQGLTVSNPGTASLQWQVSSVTDDGAPWLGSNLQSGSLDPGSQQILQVGVNPQKLALGVYKGHLTLTARSAGGMQNGTQTIYINLVVQPLCSLHVSPATLSFNTGGTQPATSSGTVNVTSASGCNRALSWSASSSTVSGGNWLSLATRSGTTPGQLGVNVNGTGLAAGSYTGVVNINNSGNPPLPLHITLSVAQGGGTPPPPPPPPPAPPVLTASPGSLTFNGTAGASNPAGQAVMLGNSGGSSLNWHATTTSTWLQPDITSGSLLAKKSATINVTANIAGLAAGDYSDTLQVSATNSKGQPLKGQQVKVTLHLQTPCTISLGAGSLSFAGTEGGQNPAAQSVSLTVNGGCGHPITWSTSPASSWLTLNPTSGTLSAGQSVTVNAGVSLAGLTANTYSDQITFSATDSVTGQSIGTAALSVTLQLQAAAISATPTPTSSAIIRPSYALDRLQ